MANKKEKKGSGSRARARSSKSGGAAAGRDVEGQALLLEVEHPAYNELSKLVRDLKKVRSRRMSLTKEECELADSLIALMKEHKLKHFVSTGLDVEIVPEGEKVKIRKHKPESSGSGDAGGGSDTEKDGSSDSDE